MAMDDDTLVRPSARGSSSILEILGRTATSPIKAGQEPGRDGDGLTTTDTRMERGQSARFDPDSKDYKAFGWVSNQTLPSLRFIFKDKSEWAGSYAHLDTCYPGGCAFIPSAPGKGNIIRLRFAGQSSVFMVTIEGRNLRRGWEQIQDHVAPWVQEYPSDIDTESEDAGVVKSITFTPEK